MSLFIHPNEETKTLTAHGWPAPKGPAGLLYKEEPKPTEEDILKGLCREAREILGDDAKVIWNDREFNLDGELTKGN